MLQRFINRSTARNIPFIAKVIWSHIGVNSTVNILKWKVNIKVNNRSYYCKRRNITAAYHCFKRNITINWPSISSWFCTIHFLVNILIKLNLKENYVRFFHAFFKLKLNEYWSSVLSQINKINTNSFSSGVIKN